MSKRQPVFLRILVTIVFICQCLSEECLTYRAFKEKFRENLKNTNIMNSFQTTNFLGAGGNSLAFKIDWFTQVGSSAEIINKGAALRITDVGVLSDDQIKQEYKFHIETYKKVGRCIPEVFACIIDEEERLPAHINSFRPNDFKRQKATYIRILIMENGLGDLSPPADKNPVLKDFLQSGDKSVLSTLSQISYCLSKFHSHHIAHLDIKNANIILTKDRYDLINDRYLATDHYRGMIIDFSDATDFDTEVQSGSLIYADSKYIKLREGKKVYEEWTRKDKSNPERDVYALGMTFLYMLINESDENTLKNYFGTLTHGEIQKKMTEFFETLENKNHQSFLVANNCYIIDSKIKCLISLLKEMLKPSRKERIISAADVSKYLGLMAKGEKVYSKRESSSKFNI